MYYKSARTDHLQVHKSSESIDKNSIKSETRKTEV